MTKLKCTVTNCLYNEDKLCSKDDITVEGKNATDKDSTCCGSFRERTGNSMKNSASHASQMTDVDCEAVNCTYNESCKCKADSIDINGSSACQCEETRCQTFNSNCK
ncbi:MAG: DUF1540 domain-containing protein [Eubacterium sp.]|nr:DUF1540 domain-containing protein [Eubacterium sp.]